MIMLCFSIKPAILTVCRLAIIGILLKFLPVLVCQAIPTSSEPERVINRMELRWNRTGFLKDMSAVSNMQFTRSGFINTCGDGILDADEDCDCGPSNCSKNPCCDGDTCLFVDGAECAQGECCSKGCKLKSNRDICRPAKNSCDLSETCSGTHAECPPDAFKRNGENCDKNDDGYCYNRICMSRTLQCETVWGIHSISALNECYHQFNFRGTFNGHCGLDSSGSTFKPCATSDVLCGNLQCRGGGYTPLPTQNSVPMFATQILTNASGTLIQCKTRSPERTTRTAVETTLVRDGTKCGPSKICLKGHCVSVDFIKAPALCPTANSSAACSGKGFCSDLGTCACQRGFMGEDCNQKSNVSARPSYQQYGSNMLNLRRAVVGHTADKMTDSNALQIVVIIVSVIVLGAMVLIMSLTCCGVHANSESNSAVVDPDQPRTEGTEEPTSTLMANRMNDC